MDGNGKLVCAMGRHGFSGIFPTKHLLTVWHVAAFTYPAIAIAAEEKVASALNRLAD